MLTMIFVYSMACGPKEPVQPPEVQTEQSSAVSAVQEARVFLDGEDLLVDWDDGDTFAATKADGTKINARLNGFNTLESYGPVHQWGEWTEQELYVIAKEAGTFASSKKWNCTDTKQSGGYGRILVDCPDLRKEILEAGLAHPFSVGNPAPEADLQAMQLAMKNKAGMWAKGNPNWLLTSLHSQEEKPGEEVYNRVCELSKGMCNEQGHHQTFASCEKFCFEDSCMTYVPYASRYGADKASCLRTE